MPRRKFPSDDKRRKTRPHVKIHLTCRSHPHYGHVFENPHDRGMAWGLWFLGVQYFAPNDGGKVTLGRGDLAWLSGRTQWASALNAVRTLCERLEYPMTVEGQRVTITIRNLQRKQGFPQQNQGSDSALRSGANADSCVAPRTPHSPDTDTDTDTEADRESEPPARAPRKTKKKTQCPEDLTSEQWGRVHTWRDKNRPTFRDTFVEDQWAAHSEHHRSKENTAADWVLSFYGWLRREWCKPPPAPPREQPPEHVSTEEPPPDLTEAEKAAMHAEHLEGKAKRRRRTPPTEEE